MIVNERGISTFWFLVPQLLTTAIAVLETLRLHKKCIELPLVLLLVSVLVLLPLRVVLPQDVDLSLAYSIITASLIPILWGISVGYNKRAASKLITFITMAIGML